LAPEHPFPAQLEDSLKVWRWLRGEGQHHGLDPDRIVAAGDSAGGQMSAALVLVLQELGQPQLQGTVLIYPGLGADTDTRSYVRNAHAPGLSREDMKYYLRSFLGPEGGSAWHNPKALPNLAADVSGFPPTFITVAGHDPVHDDGVIFFEKLKAAGVSVQLREEAALAHSYMRARRHSQTAKEGFDAIVKALKALAWEGKLPV
jgi:acetyl esterase